MNIEPATLADFHALRRLLETQGLPTEDLTEESMRHFLVLRHAGEVNGAVGLELFGDVALLRSLVVDEKFRGRGQGTELTKAAETLANRLGVKALYLLSTSAAPFFSLLGYRRIDREDAPSQIKATTQFSALCPSSAVVMVKS